MPSFAPVTAPERTLRGIRLRAPAPSHIRRPLHCHLEIGSKPRPRRATCRRGIVLPPSLTIRLLIHTIHTKPKPVRPRQCVVLCVFFPFTVDIKFVGRTSRGHTGGRSHRISHLSSFRGACLNFSREKDSVIPFPRRL